MTDKYDIGKGYSVGVLWRDGGADKQWAGLRGAYGRAAPNQTRPHHWDREANSLS